MKWMFLRVIDCMSHGPESSHNTRSDEVRDSLKTSLCYESGKLPIKRFMEMCSIDIEFPHSQFELLAYITHTMNRFTI